MSNFLLTFNPLTFIDVVPFAVINDKQAEDSETLTASLHLLAQPPSSHDQRVVLAPNTTLIQILDNDGMVEQFRCI